MSHHSCPVVIPAKAGIQPASHLILENMDCRFSQYPVGTADGNARLGCGRDQIPGDLTGEVSGPISCRAGNAAK